MVSHEAVLAALNSELITAYVEAVIVPSKPERKTFVIIAGLLVFSMYGEPAGRGGECVYVYVYGGDTDLDPYKALWRLPSS